MNAPNQSMDLMEWVKRMEAMSLPVPRIEYEPGEVISPLYRVDAWFGGVVLRVPMNNAAVVTLRDGQLMGLPGGDHYLRVGPGRYLLRYVNMMQQQMNGVSVSGWSRDGFEVGLRLNVSWRVCNPLMAAALKQAEQTVHGAVRDVVVNLMRDLDHDQLVQVQNPGSLTISSEQVALYLKDQLRRRAISQAVEVLEIYVLERQGDSFRTGVFRDAYGERMEIAQARLLERERAGLEAVKLTERGGLIPQREWVDVRAAQAEARKTEAEEEVRLVKADYASRETDALFYSRLQQAELQRALNEQQLHHERAMAELGLRENALAQVASVLLTDQRSGVPHPLSADMKEVLVKAFGQAAGAGGDDGRMEPLVRMPDGPTHNGHRPGGPQENGRHASGAPESDWPADDEEDEFPGGQPWGGPPAGQPRGGGSQDGAQGGPHSGPQSGPQDEPQPEEPDTKEARPGGPPGEQPEEPLPVYARLMTEVAQLGTELRGASCDGLESCKDGSAVMLLSYSGLRAELRYDRAYPREGPVLVGLDFPGLKQAQLAPRPRLSGDMTMPQILRLLYAWAARRVKIEAFRHGKAHDPAAEKMNSKTE